MKPKLTRYDEMVPWPDSRANTRFVGWKCEGGGVRQVGRDPDDALFRWFRKLLDQGHVGAVQLFLAELSDFHYAKFIRDFDRRQSYMTPTPQTLPIRQAWKDIEPFVTMHIPEPPRPWWKEFWFYVTGQWER